MPGVWLFVHRFVPYEPPGCVLASRRSYGHAAAPSCASASSSLMIPSTATMPPNAHSKSAIALLTARAAFLGSSIMFTGTVAGVSTSRRSFELQAATAPRMETIAASDSAPPRALPRAPTVAPRGFCCMEVIGEIRPLFRLLGIDRGTSVGEANGQYQRRELRHMRLVHVHRRSGDELAFRIQARVRRPRVHVARRERQPGPLPRGPGRELLRHVVRERDLPELEILRVVDHEVAKRPVGLHLHELPRIRLLRLEVLRAGDRKSTR